MVDEEKEKPFKIGYMTLYAKFFMDVEYVSQKCDAKKIEKLFYILTYK